ncbi:MAG: GSCFA domain-containing protein [Bacteroidota bacterium]
MPIVFRTELKPGPAVLQFGYENTFLAAGSCFAQCMRNRLLDNRLPVHKFDPGTVFNPISLFEALSGNDFPLKAPITGTAVGKPNTGLFAERDGKWFSYRHSSKFFGNTQAELIEKLSRLKPNVPAADVWLLTLGTAYVYELAETGEPVANCHKMPGGLFRKRMLSPGETEQAFENMITSLPQVPAAIILTVSPVRHTRDTLELNSVSKAVLRLAAHNICSKFEGVHYFPAFELLNDDLRDYRFYADDLIHPSAQAEEYIWQKFAETWLSAEARETSDKWQLVKRNLAHRSSEPGSDAHRAFLERTIAQLKALPKAIDVADIIAGLRGN